MITTIEALSFLEKHQPMPKDEDLKKEEIEKYEEVRKFFLDNPDEKCIPLFLNSFGGKDGFGIYQMVEDVITKFNKKTVLPYALDALKNGSENVKYWCVQIVSNFPDDRLFHPLVELLELEDEDIKSAAITALAQLALNNLCVKEVIKVLEDEVDGIMDEEIKGFAEEVLDDVKNSKYTEAL